MPSVERTLAIIKPDAVAAGHAGEILTAVERAGMRILAMQMLRLSSAQARGFYSVHREKPFFPTLVDFMTSGPIVAMVLEGENVIARWRELMGATNPAQAAPGTLRARFGTDVTRNAVHGSDAPQTAAAEMAYMFGGRNLDDA